MDLESKEIMELKNDANELLKISDWTLDNIIQDFSLDPLKETIVKKMFMCVRKSTIPERQPSDDWKLYSLLLYINSPASYNYLCDQEILPLSRISTIRKHLSSKDFKTAYSEYHLDILRNAVRNVPAARRHGILVFDEIIQRQTQSVDYISVDFEEETEREPVTNTLARRGILLLYQPLNSADSHLMSIFGKRGPAQGHSLAKLVIEGIINLENMGLQIHGVVCDGGIVDRDFWSYVGVSGYLGNVSNYFLHPLTDERKVFVFVDPPYLIKMIRDRFEKYDLKMNKDEDAIKWSHIVEMHHVDRRLTTPLCPELTMKNLKNTDHCLKVTTFSVIQIFNPTVVDALRVHRENSEALKDSENTAKFCHWMSRMYKALTRRKRPGLRMNSPLMQTLKDSCVKLDEWEQRKKNNLIRKTEFFSSHTARGLRLTLKSMIDITKYLTEKYNLKILQSGYISKLGIETCYRYGRFEKASIVDEN